MDIHVQCTFYCNVQPVEIYVKCIISCHIHPLEIDIHVQCTFYCKLQAMGERTIHIRIRSLRWNNMLSCLLYFFLGVRISKNVMYLENMLTSAF
jgi:hypothetical protein